MVVMRRVRFAIFTLAALVSLASLGVTTTFWIWSNYARWERIDIARRTVTELLDDNGQPYLARVVYRGVLFEDGSVVLYRNGGTTLENLGPRTGWMFNEIVAGANLREP